MTGTIIALVLAVVLGATARWLLRTGRPWFGFVLGVAAVAPVLVAIRDLPGPLIDGLLIAGLVVVAVVTVRPLLRDRGADDRVRRGGGS